MRRFEALWEAWATRLRPEGAAALLGELTDEDVIELLTAAPEGCRRERNLLATEALNRMSRARRVIVQSARDLTDELTSIQALVASSLLAARERDSDAPLADQDVRNEAREQVLDHIRAGSLSGLERLSARLVEGGEKSLATARHREMYD